MPTNRFTEFNPNDHVSTYVPLPVEFMAKALEAKQGQYDNALAQADAAEEAFKINAIDKHQQFKQQKQKEYNDKLTEISDYIVKTGDTSRAREIKSLANRWKNDADVNEMQMSKTQWDLDQAAILKATNDRVYNERNNPFTGFQGVNPDGTIQGYRARGVRPTKDYTAGADLAIDNIKANLDSTHEYVDNAKVINTAMQVAPTFLMSENNQDFIDEAFGRQMPAYSQLTPELQAQLVPLAANYLAKRAAPQIFNRDVVVKDFGSSSSSSSSNGGKNLYTIPNDILKLQQNLDSSKTGEASADAYTVTAMLGGNYDAKTGKSVININSESPTYINMVKKGSSNKESSQLSIYASLQNKLNRVTSAIKDKLWDLTSEGKQYTDPKNGNLYYMDPSLRVHQTSLDGKKTLMSLSDFVKTQDEGAEIYNQAKQSGIDINDPKYKTLIKKEDSVEVLNDLSTAISGINGSFEFFTDNNSKNVFTGDDGGMYVNGFIQMNEDELEDIMPDGYFSRSGWKDALDKGIVKKQTKRGSNGEVIYNLPIIKKVEGNLDDAVSNQMMNKYGDKEKVQDLILQYQDENKQYKQNRENSKEINSKLKLNQNDYSNSIRQLIDESTKESVDLNNKYQNTLDNIELDKNASEDDRKMARLLLEYQIKSEVYNDQNSINIYNSLLNTISKSGDLGLRNNNPGNLTETVNGQTQLAKYSTIEEGYSKMVSDLDAKKSGKSKTGLNGESTVLDLTKVYAPKDDNKTALLKGNDPEKYAQKIADTLGIDINTPLKYVSTKKLAKAMIQIESPDSYNKLFN